jgi:hypothetical protein
VGKDSKNFIKSYLFDNEYTIYDEILPLRVLPQIEPALMSAVSQDVLSYIRANKYNIRTSSRMANILNTGRT